MNQQANPVQRSPIFPPGLIFGLLLAAAGVLLLLDNAGVLRIGNIFRLWPLLLVAMGVTHVAQAEDSTARAWGAILGIVGLVFLADSLGWLHVRFSLIWPLGLVALGALMLWRSLEPTRFADATGASVNRLNLWTIFGGGKRRITSQIFEGGDITAVFGGWEIDLRKAGIPGNEITLNVLIVFGGLEIRIPDEWGISLQAVAMFGGNEDKTIQPPNGGAKHVVVKGFVIFGGVTTQN